MKVDSNSGAFKAIRTLLINMKTLKLLTRRKVDCGSDISVLMVDILHKL